MSSETSETGETKEQTDFGTWEDIEAHAVVADWPHGGGGRSAQIGDPTHVDAEVRCELQRALAEDCFGSPELWENKTVRRAVANALRRARYDPTRLLDGRAEMRRRAWYERWAIEVCSPFAVTAKWLFAAEVVRSRRARRETFHDLRREDFTDTAWHRLLPRNRQAIIATAQGVDWIDDALHFGCQHG